MRFLASFLILLAMMAEPAFAYIGPGAGLGAIGSLLGMIAAVFVAIFGFVWYPIKRILKGRKSSRTTDDEDD